MKSDGYESVWDALKDDPGEAANMKLRAAVMMALEREVRSWGLTQAEAAKRLGISQPRLSNLLAGRITEFSLDALVDLSARAGLRLDLQTTRVAA